MFDFDALSQAILSRTVLCVGDLMLDEFVYGAVSRISRSEEHTSELQSLV